MPTGYAGEGKQYSKKLGRWLKKETTKAFDYSEEKSDASTFVISFFRFYPDYFADLCRSPEARYELEIPQRMMMRILSRYKDTFITGVRGLTKTYTIILTKMIEGILYPGEIMRYQAPNQKQAAALATQAFHQIEKDYPIIAEYWMLKSDRTDMFRIQTNYGSQFTMYAPRGDNSAQTIAEEIGQEGKEAFGMEKYERDVLGTCRIDRYVNKMPDRTHINLKHAHITNACSRVNPAYYKHRADCLKSMVHGNQYAGYVIDLPWTVALLCNIRSIAYIEDLRKKLSANDWQREMCAIYTGSGEEQLLSDETITRAKTLQVMEDKHCGDKEAIYIVSHDVSYAVGSGNAKCADVVLKLTKYQAKAKRDKYRKQVVYVDNYDPPATDYLQASKLKKLWSRYCLDGGETTYLVVDAQAYGTGVVEELMKPTDDGTLPLCCVKHEYFREIEQPNAIPVIVPIKDTIGTAQSMIRYAQKEFEQGYVELLIGNIYDGVEAYKNFHKIKDVSADGAISLPYRQTEVLCQQIANLRVKVSGTTIKENRKVNTIQRDIWSALKYALYVAYLLEELLVSDSYTSQNSWASVISSPTYVNTCANARYSILSLRRR